jgi:hypothetical protein
MTFVISVRAIDDGWRVQGDTLENGMLFLSGAEAEGAARTLAERYAEVGQFTEIQVFLRDGSLAGRYVGVPEIGMR